MYRAPHFCMSPNVPTHTTLKQYHSMTIYGRYTKLLVRGMDRLKARRNDLQLAVIARKAFWHKKSKGGHMLKLCTFMGIAGYIKTSVVRSHMKPITEAIHSEIHSLKPRIFWSYFYCNQPGTPDSHHLKFRDQDQANQWPDLQNLLLQTVCLSDAVPEKAWSISLRSGTSSWGEQDWGGYSTPCRPSSRLQSIGPATGMIHLASRAVPGFRRL